MGGASLVSARPVREMGIMSSRKCSVPRAALEHYFRELPDYVVLRNEEDVFAHLERGGDLDLLVGNLDLAERTLIRHLGCPIRITRRSYVRENFYDWGSVDLLPSIEWRGASYLRTDSVFDGRRLSEGGRPVPRLAHVALISWFSSLLWGGFFKERYASVIRQAVEADGLAFRQALTEAAGHRWGDRLWRMAAEGHPEKSATWTVNLRRAVWWRAFTRAPFRTSQHYCSFVIRELRLRFAPPVPWVAILGSDRGRRSAIVSDLLDRFSQSSYGHVKAIQWSARRTGLKRLVQATEWFVTYWTRWVNDRAKGYILALDGDHASPFAASWRNRSGSNRRGAARWLLPKPDLVFVLDSPSDELRGTDEGTPAELAPEMHQTAAGPEPPAAHVLNGRAPVSVLGESIQRVIRAWMLDRTAASIGNSVPPIVTATRAVAEGSHGPQR